MSRPASERKKQEGSGRVKGNRNKLTLRREKLLVEEREAIARQLEASGLKVNRLTAHGLLMAIYMCEDLPLFVRMAAANSAIPYEKPRLQAVTIEDPSKKGVARIVFDAGDEGI